MLRKERKPRHVMALERFIAKRSGFLGKSADASLNDLGLADVCPSHYHRPGPNLDLKEFSGQVMWRGGQYLQCTRLSCDFCFRYYRRSCTVLHEALEK